MHSIKQVHGFSVLDNIFPVSSLPFLPDLLLPQHNFLPTQKNEKGFKHIKGLLGFQRDFSPQEKSLWSPVATGEIPYGTKNQEGRENYPGDDFPVGNPIKGFPGN